MGKKSQELCNFFHVLPAIPLINCTGDFSVAVWSNPFLNERCL